MLLCVQASTGCFLFNNTWQNLWEVLANDDTLINVVCLRESVRIARTCSCTFRFALSAKCCLCFICTVLIYRNMAGLSLASRSNADCFGKRIPIFFPFFILFFFLYIEKKKKGSNARIGLNLEGQTENRRNVWKRLFRWQHFLIYVILICINNGTYNTRHMKERSYCCTRGISENAITTINPYI